MSAFSQGDWQRAEGEENADMQAQQEAPRAILIAFGDTTLRETSHELRNEIVEELLLI